MLAGIRPRARWLDIVLGVGVMVGLAGSPALAQGPKAPSSATSRARPAAKPAPKRAPASPPGDGTAPRAAAATTTSAAETSPAGAGDAGVVEARTLDGGTHVFKFSELDIEGRLKSPQLVYFLRRVRAEFAAGDLGHRSFMREMSETRKEPSF
jgi:hypothetical protein